MLHLRLQRAVCAFLIAFTFLMPLARPAFGADDPTEQDKARKALDSARLWLQEAKRRLGGANDRALGFIGVALQKVESAKGAIEDKAAADKAAADKAAADKKKP